MKSGSVVEPTSMMSHPLNEANAAPGELYLVTPGPGVDTNRTVALVGWGLFFVGFLLGYNLLQSQTAVAYLVALPMMLIGGVIAAVKSPDFVELLRAGDSPAPTRRTGATRSILHGAPLGWWWFAVFLLGWVGGVIGFIVLKDTDLPRAKRTAIWGVIWSATLVGVALLASYVALIVALS